MPPSQTARFRRRLRDYIRENYEDNRAAFEKACRLPRSTTARWLGEHAKMPNGETLAQMMKHTTLSADWLLTGQGFPERQATGDAVTDVRALVRHKLQQAGVKTETRDADFLPEGPEFLAWVVQKAEERVKDAQQAHKQYVTALKAVMHDADTQRRKEDAAEDAEDRAAHGPILTPPRRKR